MHNHGNMIEICLLESGRQNYIVEGQEYSLTGGDVFLTHPHEKHSTGLFPEEKGMLYWMLIYIPKACTCQASAGHPREHVYLI